MIIKVKEKEYTGKYTFNSFRYLQEFDISEIETIDETPFKILPLASMLLQGALNYDPKRVFTMGQVEKILEDYMEESNIGDLLTELVEELQESSFFKSLQMKKPKGKR